jgi:nitrite reductase/ring-hydroxylating ferredoxin subunit
MDENGGDPGIGRRVLLTRLGLGTFLASLAGTLAAGVRFVFPKALDEPPSRFKAPAPETFTEGSVFAVEEHKAFILRDEQGVSAMSAVCTHLGCTVKYMDSQREFHCPCHGSKFDHDGKNIAGPAPRPLPRLDAAVARDGRLEVDTLVEVPADRRVKADGRAG